jgi:3-ketosteroid 9alpha-monooxygenase subunit A
VATVDELTEPENPVDAGGRALMVVRTDGGMQAYDARCPHRGAHLGYGGRVEGECMVCPFHGRRIHLGAGRVDHPFQVQAHPTLEVGGAVFVRLDSGPDNGFTHFMGEVARTKYLVAGPVFTVAVAPEFVIENVFDAEHFQVVHALDRRPALSCRPGEHGELLVEGTFAMARPNKWQEPAEGAGGGAEAQAHFLARVFSPLVVATELGSTEEPNVVVTAATPTAGGGCVVRVLVAMARTTDGKPTTVRAISSLMSGTVTAFEQDRVVWEHLDPSAPWHYAPGDELVQAFRSYCSQFAGAGPQ